jgi:hypothetical protein
LDLRRTLFLAITVTGLTGSLAHCGSSGAAGLAPSFGAGVSGEGGRTPWDGTPSGSEQDSPSGGDTGGSTAGATNTGPAAAAQDGGAFCPGVTPDAKIVNLAVPSARATGSPAQARGVLIGDPVYSPTAPARATVRPGEFLNYYQAGTPTVQAITVSAGLEKGVLPTERLLQVTLTAPPAPPRGPTMLAAVVDTSISMTGEPFARAKASAHALLAALQPGDTFVLVTSNPTVPPAPFPVDGATGTAAAGAAIDGLALGADGDFAGAVVKAYDGPLWAQNALNRVALISNGAFPLSTLDLGLIAKNAERHDIAVLGVGVGHAQSYDDTALSLAAAAGRGADVYIDSVDEADAMLRKRFDEVMNVAARDVHVTVTLPWHLSAEAAPSAGDAGGGGDGGLAVTDLGSGRSLIFRQKLVACGPIPDIDQGTIQVAVSYTSPRGDLEHVDVPATDMATLLAMDQAGLARADAILTFANALLTQDLTRANAVQPVLYAPAFDLDPDFTAPGIGLRALIDAEITQLGP